MVNKTAAIGLTFLLLVGSFSAQVPTELTRGIPPALMSYLDAPERGSEKWLKEALRQGVSAEDIAQARALLFRPQPEANDDQTREFHLAGWDPPHGGLLIFPGGTPPTSGWPALICYRNQFEERTVESLRDQYGSWLGQGFALLIPKTQAEVVRSAELKGRDPYANEDLLCAIIGHGVSEFGLDRNRLVFGAPWYAMVADAAPSLPSVDGRLFCGLYIPLPGGSYLGHIHDPGRFASCRTVIHHGEHVADSLLLAKARLRHAGVKDLVFVKDAQLNWAPVKGLSPKVPEAFLKMKRPAPNWSLEFLAAPARITRRAYLHVRHVPRETRFRARLTGTELHVTTEPELVPSDCALEIYLQELHTVDRVTLNGHSLLAGPPPSSLRHDLLCLRASYLGLRDFTKVLIHAR